MIMLAGAWPGASGKACAALPDSPKMKARATSLFIRFSPELRLLNQMILGQAESFRKELICSRDDVYWRENFGIDSANPLKHASRSSCSWTKRQSITPFAAGGFGLGFGGMMTS
jgi:hypothetical protein